VQAKKRNGPECSVCTDKRRAAIEEACEERGVVSAASKYRLARSTLAKHWGKHARLVTSKRGPTLPPPAALRAATDTPAKAPELKNLGPGATELEQVTAQCDWLAAMIKWESDSTEKLRFSDALMRARKLQSKLSGSSDVSMQTLMRSPHWIRLYTAVADTLEKHPKALEAVRRELEILTTGAATTVAGRAHG
jgi:hypothetical protein